RERPFQYGLEIGLPGDLAADIADEAAKSRSQEAQLAMMTLELLGVGMWANRLSPLIAACSSLASVGKVTALGWTVVSTVTRLISRGRSAPVACATRELSASRSSSLLPSRFLQWLRSERSCGKSC